MKYKPILLLLLIITACNTNEKENRIFKKCPEKIISLTLASDEVLLDLTDSKRILGVTYLAKDKNLSNVAEKAKQIKNVFHANLEQVISQKPDLVIIANYISQDFITQINESGINTLTLHDVSSINDIKKNIELIGKEVCEDEKASNLVKEMEQKVEKHKNNINQKPTVLYLFPSGFTAGDQTTVGEMIEITGGINLGKKAGLKGNKRISTEYIVENDPDIIIVNSHNINEPKFIEKIKSDKVLKNLSAVKNGNIYIIETKNLTSVSHYMAQGIKDLSQIISNFHAN